MTRRGKGKGSGRGRGRGRGGAPAAAAIADGAKLPASAAGRSRGRGRGAATAVRSEVIPSLERKACALSQWIPATLPLPVPPTWLSTPAPTQLTAPTALIVHAPMRAVSPESLPGTSLGGEPQFGDWGEHSSPEPNYNSELWVDEPLCQEVSAFGSKPDMDGASDAAALYQKESALRNQMEMAGDVYMDDEVSDIDMDDEASDVDDGASDEDTLRMPPGPSHILNVTLNPDMTTEFKRQDQDDRKAMCSILPPEGYSFDWSKDISHFKGIRETFTGTPGPTFNTDEIGKPVDAFLKIFDADFVELIARETNRYADQYIAKTQFKRHARIKKWAPTNKEEMYVFLALLMHQGICPLLLEKDYFYSKRITAMPFFSRVMNYNRFLLVKKFLHFTNNESLFSDVPLSVRRLRKIQPVLDHLSNKFETLYLPEQEIFLDESLLGSKGRSGFVQMVKTKAVGAGIKSYELCETKSGYLWKFQICAGKTIYNQAEPTNPDKEDTTQAKISGIHRAAAKIVYDLASPLFNKGHTLIMNNSNNSPLLARCLKRSGMDCMGTLRLNREFVPNAFKNHLKIRMSEGEVEYSNCGDLNLMVWLDKNLISMLSTYHRADTGEIEKFGAWTYRPELVLDYNMLTGGVDGKDQLLAGFPIERQRNLVWYKKLFRRLLNVSVHNAYVLYSSKLRKENKHILYRNFRGEVVEDLLLLFYPGKVDTLTTTGPMPVGRTLRPILKGNHFSVHIGKRITCAWCKIKKKSKRTGTKCNVCDMALCLKCMIPYHTELLNR